MKNRGHSAFIIPHSSFQVMQLCTDIHADPAANVALDEALLERADGEYLRLWESSAPVVVLGRSAPIEREVDISACAAAGVPVVRRPSGGQTVLIGPGCLMYAVVLDLQTRPELAAIDRAHQFVLGKMLAALRPLAPNIEIAGTSDLVLAGDPSHKFSGNALRLKRTHLLYHGTLLYDFDLALVERLLTTPVRQPTYRAERSHREFLTNFPASRNEIEAAIRRGWEV
jgi:lipoate---protein ligase